MVQQAMGSLIKRGLASRYETSPVGEIAAASPAILKGISKRSALMLAQRYQIGSIADLCDRWSRLDQPPKGIDPALVAKLICFLNYPKYDPGPPCGWEALFEAAPLDYYVNHPSGSFRTRFGPVFYRGRLDGTARVLVVGQDPATDELITQRALVGEAGQRLQRLLNKLGVTRSYIMLNTFLYGIIGQYQPAIALEPAILGYRNQVFDRAAAQNPLSAVFAFGKAAQDSVSNWPGKAALQVVKFTHPTADDQYVIPNWNSNLATAHALVGPDADGSVDLTPYAAAPDLAPIPRRDLPFGVPVWQGTQGTRSRRNGEAEIVWEAV